MISASPAVPANDDGCLADYGGQPFHVRLRQATSSDHAAVDVLFSRFRLDDACSYRSFVVAHARVLPAAERWIDGAALLSGWEGRTAALAADMTMLGCAMPAPSPIGWHRSEAARWGALYVVEGSRLGGKLLSRRVGRDLPRAYLSKGHASGAWRGFLDNLDHVAARNGIGWQREASRSASLTFMAYRDAAAIELALA